MSLASHAAFQHILRAANRKNPGESWNQGDGMAAYFLLSESKDDKGRDALKASRVPREVLTWSSTAKATCSAICLVNNQRADLFEIFEF